MDLHSADRRHRRTEGGDRRGALFAETVDRKRSADPVGRQDLLGPVDALRPARGLRLGRDREGHRLFVLLFRGAPAGRPCSLRHRGVARRFPASSFGRERPLLPHPDRRGVRNPSDGVPVVYPDAAPARGVGPHEPAQRARLRLGVRHRGAPCGEGDGGRRDAGRAGGRPQEAPRGAEPRGDAGIEKEREVSENLPRLFRRIGHFGC